MTRRARRREEPFTGRRAVLLFMAAGLGAVVLTAALGYVFVRRVATSEAIHQARSLTESDARAVGPLLTDEVLARDPRAVAELDEAVRRIVLSDQVVRVKVWAEDGTIVYSDLGDLVGERYPLGEDDREALRTGHADAEVSDLAQPENRGERRYGKLLEVYLGVRTPTGTPLLFEVYERFDAVSASATRLLGSFVPALLVGLVALWLVQLPLAIALTRRVRSGYARQRALLGRAIESSEHERRRIAADLHDSVVQGLAGASMSLSALAGRSEPDVAPAIQEHAAALRQWVRELRTLTVSIAPPRLHDEGLSAALADLASAVEARGLTTTVEVADRLVLSPTAEALVFRATQEALRNVVGHADASHVEIAVGDGGGRIHLRVADDGRGFDPAALPETSAGEHIGLRLLGQLAGDAGGSLRVESAPGAGTTLTLEVPA